MKSPYQKGMEEKLTSLITPIVADFGCELVELQLVQRKAAALLRVLVDRVGGVTIDHCAELSRRISFQLDIEDPLDSRYTLEVSSPGLDRPLISREDFHRKVGETVRLSLKAPANVPEVVGEIVKVDDARLVLRTRAGEESIPLEDIVRGKIVF